MSAVVTVRTQRRPLVDVARDYISLTKPRVILREVTTLFAMIAAAHGWPG